MHFIMQIDWGGVHSSCKQERRRWSLAVCASVVVQLYLAIFYHKGTSMVLASGLTSL
jgi:hypothetical protein